MPLPVTNPADVYGTRLPQIPLPDPFGNLSGVLSGLPGLNSAATSAIMSKLQGQLSPATLAALQNDSARFAVKSGMPGTNAIPGTIPFNRSQRDLGRAVEDVQAQGLQLLNPFIANTSATQTVRPELQYEQALQNAINAASPEPGAAGRHLEDLFDYYLNKSGPQSGTRGTGGIPTYSYAPKPVAGSKAARPPVDSLDWWFGPSLTSVTPTGVQTRRPGEMGYTTTDSPLWSNPQFGPWGFSGAIQPNSAPAAATPTMASNFYAGPNNVDPETGLQISPWTGLGTSDYGSAETVPPVDPLDWFWNPTMF